MLSIIQAESAEQVSDAKDLFREYESWLGLDLCFQGFETELLTLPGKYARPSGRLLLAYADGAPAGCIAMRKLDDEICEMKRLFVRDAFRGNRVGNSLIENIIAEASHARYKKMRLDTYPQKMGAAVKLYQARGFYEITPYYENPYDGVVFMELIL